MEAVERPAVARQRHGGAIRSSRACGRGWRGRARSRRPRGIPRRAAQAAVEGDLALGVEVHVARRGAGRGAVVDGRGRAVGQPDDDEAAAADVAGRRAGQPRAKPTAIAASTGCAAARISTPMRDAFPRRWPRRRACRWPRRYRSAHLAGPADVVGSGLDRRGSRRDRLGLGAAAAGQRQRHQRKHRGRAGDAAHPLQSRHGEQPSRIRPPVRARSASIRRAPRGDSVPPHGTQPLGGPTAIAALAARVAYGANSRDIPASCTTTSNAARARSALGARLRAVAELVVARPLAPVARRVPPSGGVFDARPLAAADQVRTARPSPSRVSGNISKTGGCTRWCCRPVLGRARG